MSIDDLLKRVDKLNKRVTHEWDAFMKEHGTHWDTFNDEAKAKACELAEMQAERWVKHTT